VIFSFLLTNVYLFCALTFPHEASTILLGAFFTHGYSTIPFPFSNQVSSSGSLNTCNQQNFADLHLRTVIWIASWDISK